jgi:hypothetical protein
MCDQFLDRIERGTGMHVVGERIFNRFLDCERRAPLAIGTVEPYQSGGGGRNI